MFPKTVRTTKVQTDVKEPAMSTRILVRHLKPGNRVLICGRPETVVRIEIHGQQVHVFTPDDPSDPYLYTDSDLISLLPRT